MLLRLGYFLYTMTKHLEVRMFFNVLKRYDMNLSALSTSCINGRFGTSQRKKMKPISDANFISLCRNSLSSDNIPTPSDIISIVNSPIVPTREVVRCSFSLQLPCNLEFSFSEKTTNQSFSDDISSSGYFALFEGSEVSV